MKILGLGSVFNGCTVVKIEKSGVTFRLPDDTVEVLSLFEAEKVAEKA
jgi:hypothetical protein